MSKSISTLTLQKYKEQGRKIVALTAYDYSTAKILDNAGVDLILVGDSLKDLQTAVAYGCRPMLVKTGKGTETLKALQAGAAGIPAGEQVPVFDNLAAAAREILRQQPVSKDDR